MQEEMKGPCGPWEALWALPSRLGSPLVVKEPAQVPGCPSDFLVVRSH